MTGRPRLNQPSVETPTAEAGPTSSSQMLADFSLLPITAAQSETKTNLSFQFTQQDLKRAMKEGRKGEKVSFITLEQASDAS